MAGEAELLFMGLTLMAVGGILGYMVSFIWGRIFFPRRWPIDVVIWEQRGKNIIQLTDYGAVINKQGEFFKLFLKNKKTSTKPIPFKFMQIGGGGRSVINLFSPNREEFFAVIPQMVSNGEKMNIDMSILNDDSKYWFALAQREAEQKWKQPPSFMEKWGGILLIGVIGVLIVALVYFGGQHLVDLANSGVSQAKQTAANTEIIDQIKALLTGSGPATGTAPSPTPPAPSPPVG